MVEMWTDGSCEGNPGRGGFACYIVGGNYDILLCGAYKVSTNNRMESMGVLYGLLRCKQEGIRRVVLYTDSAYVAGCLSGNTVKANQDIWDKVRVLLGVVEVVVKKVKGHSGVERNEKVDRAAYKVMRGGPWLVDEGCSKRAKKNPTKKRG